MVGFGGIISPLLAKTFFLIEIYSFFEFLTRRIILPIMQEVESSLKLNKSKSGRKPKLSNAQISTLFIISYHTNCPVLRLAQLLIDPNIKSYHILRKIRIKAIYKLLRTYMQLKAIAIVALKLLNGYLADLS